MKVSALCNRSSLKLDINPNSWYCTFLFNYYFGGIAILTLLFLNEYLDVCTLFLLYIVKFVKYDGTNEFFTLEYIFNSCNWYISLISNTFIDLNIGLVWALKWFSDIVHILFFSVILIFCHNLCPIRVYNNSCVILLNKYIFI